MNKIDKLIILRMNGFL